MLKCCRRNRKHVDASVYPQENLHALTSYSSGFQSDTVYSCLSTIPVNQRTKRNFALSRRTYAIPTTEKDFEGKEKKEEINDNATHHTHERYYGQYFRSVTLPYPVKEGEIQATFDNGVLELRLPKAEEIKAKKIEIKAQLPKPEPKKRGRSDTFITVHETMIFNQKIE